MLLPEGFEALAALSDWNLDTPDARQMKRLHGSTEETKAFYDAAVPMLPAIMTELDRFPLGDLPESHRPLFNIAMAVAEVAPHVELYHGSPGVPHAFKEERFVAAHGQQRTWTGAPPTGADQ
jgi:hypothetical protein